ncbi:MAG: XTP/dITP diphosphohydrolase [Limisphaerales bacterium]|jgi:XTP/dITP diphosphohydrolase
MEKALVFATNNLNKLQEVREMLTGLFSVRSLADIGCTEELPETGDTFEFNSMQKASYVAEKYGVDVFAEDTGLCVDALNGQPGVYSARYAGLQREAADNMNLLLSKLKDKDNRQAAFRTIFSLIRGNEKLQFEGLCKGTIATQHMGNQGFGYDPIFIPEGEERSFAQMSRAEKAAISHRGRGLQKLLVHLRNSGEI